MSAPTPAGAVLDGRFVDRRYDFTVPVPDGWRAEPATWDDTTRVVLVNPAGDVRVRVGVMPGAVTATSGPAARPDCEWAFFDTGALDLPALGTLNVATCVPADPDGARVLGWYAPGARPPIQVEADALPGRLIEAQGGGATIVDGVRGAGPPATGN